MYKIWKTEKIGTNILYVKLASNITLFNKKYLKVIFTKNLSYEIMKTIILEEKDGKEI